MTTIHRATLTLWLLHRFKIHCCPEGPSDIRFQAIVELICLNARAIREGLSRFELNHDTSSTVRATHKHHDLDTHVLWSISIGHAASIRADDQIWFETRFRSICAELGISSLEDLKNALELSFSSSSDHHHHSRSHQGDRQSHHSTHCLSHGIQCQSRSRSQTHSPPWSTIIGQEGDAWAILSQDGGRLCGFFRRMGEEEGDDDHERM